MTVAGVFRRLRGAAALVSAIAILVGPPLLLVRVGAIPHRVPSVHEAWLSFISRGNGQILFVVFTGLTFLIWAWLSVTILEETVAAVRFRPAANLQLVKPNRRPAAWLVATAAVLSATAPISALPLLQASAAGVPATAETTASAQLVPGPGQSGAVQMPTSALATVVAGQHDTWWGLAERHLPGDPATRYAEIADLNPGASDGSGRIRPGTVIILPADATTVPTQSHPGGTPAAAGRERVKDVKVTAGDNLWTSSRK